MTGKRNAPQVRTADASGPATAQTADVPNEVRAAAQAEWEKSGEIPDGDPHAAVEPTDADYEKARTVGIGNEPELPPGKFRA